MPAHQQDGELQRQRPHPTARTELLPAVDEVAQEVVAFGLLLRARSHARDQHGAGEKGASVDGDRPAGAERGDEHAGGRGAEPERGRPGERDDRVRGLELLLLDDLRIIPSRRRPVESVGDPHARGESEQQRNVGDAAKEHDGDDDLRRGGEKVGERR